MSNQHADPALTVRPPAGVKTAAQAVLRAHDRDMRAFITACLTAVATDSDTMFAALAAYWPPPKRLGRPRRPPFRDVVLPRQS